MQSITYAREKRQKAIEVLEKMLTIEDYFSEDRIELADLYTSSHKPDDVIRILRPVVHHGPYSEGGYGAEPAVRMLYVLALLGTREWEEAAAVYEPTINSNLHWQLVGRGPDHALPNIHFNVNAPDYEAMRAQAHLILGARLPISSNYATGAEDVSNQEREYMLDHLKQSIKYNAQSHDAHFVSGLLLKKLGTLSDEARKELSSAARYAPDEAQPEIKAALQDLKAREDNQKIYGTGKAAQCCEARGTFSSRSDLLANGLSRVNGYGH